eukprot:365886-Chlamydomonas_euryale.AAC.3
MQPCTWACRSDCVELSVAHAEGAQRAQTRRMQGCRYRIDELLGRDACECAGGVDAARDITLNKPWLLALFRVSAKLRLHVPCHSHASRVPCCAGRRNDQSAGRRNDQSAVHTLGFSSRQWLPQPMLPWKTAPTMASTCICRLTPPARPPVASAALPTDCSHPQIACVMCPQIAATAQTSRVAAKTRASRCAQQRVPAPATRYMSVCRPAGRLWPCMCACRCPCIAARPRGNAGSWQEAPRGSQSPIRLVSGSHSTTVCCAPTVQEPRNRLE